MCVIDYIQYENQNNFIEIQIFTRYTKHCKVCCVWNCSFMSLNVQGAEYLSKYVTLLVSVQNIKYNKQNEL